MQQVSIKMIKTKKEKQVDVKYLLIVFVNGFQK